MQSLRAIAIQPSPVPIFFLARVLSDERRFGAANLTLVEIYWLTDGRFTVIFIARSDTARVKGQMEIKCVHSNAMQTVRRLREQSAKAKRESNSKVKRMIWPHVHVFQAAMDQTAVNTNITAQLASGISRDEMAVIYSAAILADDDIAITADKLMTILKAANMSNVEPIWPTLYARALGSGCDVRRLLTSVGAVGASGSQPQQLSDGVGNRPLEKEATAADTKKTAEPEAADDDDDDDDLNLDLFG